MIKRTSTKQPWHERVARPDRIERAVRLIEDNAVTSWGEGRFHVRSDSQSIGYIVTCAECSCEDFLRHRQACKHIWVAIGATAALLIRDIRAAKTLAELESVAASYAPSMKSLPAAFVAAARDEYRKRKHELAPTGSGENNSTNSRPAPRLQVNLDDEGPLYVEAVNGPSRGLLTRRDCNHFECKTTRCGKGRSIGGIAI